MTLFLIISFVVLIVAFLQLFYIYLSTQAGFVDIEAFRKHD